MQRAISHEYSLLLLSLYRLSLECPLDQFQDAALGLVRTELAFDSSMWGTAKHGVSGIDIHTIHLHRQPIEMLHAYEAVKHLDTAAVAVSRAPAATLSFNSADWFSAPSQRPLLEYGNRFDQRNFFITSVLDLDTGLAQWVTLFRASAKAEGTEQERLLLAALMPHLQQSLKHNRMLHLSRLNRAEQPIQGSAIADARGMLYHQDPAFEEAMRLEWERWTPPAIPDALRKHFAGGQRVFCGRHKVVTCHVERDLLFLHSRPRHRADALSPRELAVARLMAQGHTHKGVAAELGRAPSTVRNHMQAIYGKLDVNSIAGLIEELRLIAE
ncbi:helix-turn-helix transcriptional regulator [Acidovorax sp.]|uniref:helix-turn-helix transcriptional regulator n=1 Tax=Acidovorax sp. TaxID=1872122 RepID=UPI00391F6536